MSSDLLGGKNSTDEDPIPLAEACRLFRLARLTVSTLRAEAARGRLIIFPIGKRHYTTLRSMREMVRRCRDEPRGHASISTRSESSGLSETDRISSAQERAKESAARLIRPSPSTSPTNTGQSRPVFPMIGDVLAVYGAEAAPHKKSARNIWLPNTQSIAVLGREDGRQHHSKVLPRLCRHEGKDGRKADLKTLKAAVDYWNKEYGPLTVVPTYWRPKDNPPKERWLTKSEAARLLRAAKPYPYLRRAILLQLYTGSRPGVVQAIRWDQIDFASGVIYRVSRGAPQGEKKRSPPARLGNRIKAHLKRWRRLDGKNANSHLPRQWARSARPAHGLAEGYQGRGA